MYTIYSKGKCAFCNAAKRLLERKGLEYEVVLIEGPEDKEKLLERVRECGSDAEIKSVPQIFYGDIHIGGYGDLERFF